MAIPYYNNIPQGTDIPAQSQPLMFTNFGSIDTLLQVDHVSFAGATDGAHNKVSLVIQTPPIAWPAGITLGLYATALGMFSHTPTGDFNFSLLNFANATTAYFHLPNGVFMQMGQRTDITGGETYNFPNTFSTACVPYVFLIGMTATAPETHKSSYVSIDTGTVAAPTPITNTRFTMNIRYSPTAGGPLAPCTASYQWFAIGY
jgi:hypothetical protein